MRVSTILHRVLGKSILSVHAKRMRALCFAVGSLLRGGRLNLTALGHSGTGTTSAKHNIKRIDRLLGNTKLHRELEFFYRGLCRWSIGQYKSPVIVVDWMDLDKRYCVLWAAVPASGRTLPIYLEVHPLQKKTSPKIERLFIQKLARLLPRGCRPTIVADAGFRNPFLRVIKTVGWHYIAPLGTNVLMSETGNARWLRACSFHRRAGRAAKDLGTWTVAQTNPELHRVILGKKPRVSSHRKTRRVNTKHRASQLKKPKQAHQPWMLATSRTDLTPSEIVAIYKKRMQIEEMFRDAKNHRFGWSLEDAVAHTPERYAVLLLIASLGTYLLTALGHIAEAKNLHRAYQANTITVRRVLSLFVLGKRILAAQQEPPVAVPKLIRAIQALVEEGKAIGESKCQ